MRIAIKTEDPLPDYKCWYAFEEDRVTTIASLAKLINKELDLVGKSGELLLLHEGFAFLSSSLVKGLIREDNLITIRILAPLKQRKTKESKALKEKQKKKEDEKKVKKKQAKQQEKDNQKKDVKQEPSKKKRKMTQAKEEGEKKSKKMKALPPPPPSRQVRADESAVAKQPQPQHPAVKESEQQPTLTRTQKRNRRKIMNRKMKREEASAIPSSTATEQEDKPEQEAAMAPPEHLLKKNKNKKKDFLKAMAKKPRAHIHFDKEQPSSTDLEEQEVADNLYGAAYVTAVETDPNYDGEQKNWAQYPVHQVKSHFYADAPPEEEDQQIITEKEDEKVSSSPPPAPLPPVVNREYESLPMASLTGPSKPEIGDLLAIKTLSMTEFYTPEISDWKEVKVSSIGEENGETVITVEYQPGFLLKKSVGRFELPDEDEDYEEDEEGQESEYAKNQTRTYSASDLVDMRKV